MHPTEELIVEGMTCSNCAQGVKKGLEKTGLESVSVDFASGEVNFQNPSKVASEEIVKVIRQLGYNLAKSEEESNKESKGLFKFLKTIEGKFYFSLIFTLPLFAYMFLPFHFLHDPMVQLCLSIPVVAIGFKPKVQTSISWMNHLWE